MTFGKTVPLKRPHLKDWFILASIFFVNSAALYFCIWLFIPEKFTVVYQNWDGPIYAVIAKTLYDPQLINSPDWAKFTDPLAYASSFPLYPLIIRLLNFIGLFQAIILASLFASLATIIAFFELIKKHKLSKNPLLLSIIFIFLPPRWFISSHIGNSEPLFVFFIILSLNYFLGKKYYVSAIYLFFAQLARSQGIIFFAGFGLVLLIEAINKSGLTTQSAKNFARSIYPFFLGPIALLLLFTWFLIQYGNFFAFFDAIGKWQVTANYPFEVFSVYPHQLVPTFWLENHYWIYFLDIITILLLFKKKLYTFAYISLLYFIPLVFLIHIDLARYNIPLAPFSLIALDAKSNTKLILITTLILLPALFLYGINFMLWNR